MFDWLADELKAIRTPGFHVVDGPADEKLTRAVLKSHLELPEAYKEFVIRFGNAKLYRNARNGSYRVVVFAGPRESRLSDGTPAWIVGFHDGATVHFVPAIGARQSSLVEVEADGIETHTDGFESWLRRACDRARSRFGKEKWEEIVRGPAPFTREEEAVVAARREFRWRVVRVDADGDHWIEVTNRSKRSPPALTLGVRTKDGRLNGAVWLNVRDVAPGTSQLCRADCYKQLVSPDEVELFALPDPRPETREAYVSFARDGCQPQRRALAVESGLEATKRK